MVIENYFNRTCLIEQDTKVFNATTGQRSKTWSTYSADVPCRLDMSRGGEKREPDDILSRETHVLYISYDPNLVNNFSYRITVDTVVYTVLLISNAGGENNHLEISLELIR